MEIDAQTYQVRADGHGADVCAAYEADVASRME
jgi:hypothetical protein